MDNAPQSTENTASFTILLASLWIGSLVIIGLLGFFIGSQSKTSQPEATQNVLSSVNSVATPTTSAQPTPSTVVTPPCAKYGLAQKWEYLTTYTIKEGDSLQEIVTNELRDSSRLNEVMQLNGANQLVVGSTLYLPPPTINKSTGNIKLVHGKLTQKNAGYWHVSFNENNDGLGILIPTFWFGEVSDKESYQVGDCVSVLLDDGFKVFSVSRQ